MSGLMAGLVLSVSLEAHPLPQAQARASEGLSTAWWLAPAACRAVDVGTRLAFAGGKRETGALNQHLVGKPAVFVAVNAAAAAGLSLALREVGKAHPKAAKVGVGLSCGVSAWGTWTNVR